MSDLSKQYHSIEFFDEIGSLNGRRNTWDAWHLIPTSRPVVNPPEAIQNLIQIPGRNGFVDLTELITGKPIYGQRTGSWEFIAHPDYAVKEPWDVKFSRIMDICHNKFKKIILEDNPNYYYEGRLKVNQWKSDRNWSLVTIDYTLDPFKRVIFSSEEPWLWDPFDFTDGYIKDDLYNNVAVSASSWSNPKVIIVSNSTASTAGSEPIIPEIISNASMQVKFTFDEDQLDPEHIVYLDTYTITSGVNVIPEIVITEPRMYLAFVGSGTVTIRYRSGWL